VEVADFAAEEDFVVTACVQVFTTVACAWPEELGLPSQQRVARSQVGPAIQGARLQAAGRPIAGYPGGYYPGYGRRGAVYGAAAAGLYGYYNNYGNNGCYYDTFGNWVCPGQYPHGYQY
jgi:hypothetical protein